MHELEEAPFPSIGDAARLIAEIKAGDENSRRKAYRAVFGGPLGAFVLADIVRSAGVGQRSTVNTLEGYAYAAGQNDLAVEIAGQAGFGPEALAVLMLSTNLEGQEYDGPIDGPEPEFGD